MVTCEDDMFWNGRSLGTRPAAPRPRSVQHTKIRTDELLKAGEIPHKQSLASGLPTQRGTPGADFSKFEQTDYWKQEKRFVTKHLHRAKRRPNCALKTMRPKAWVPILRNEEASRP